MDSNQHPHNKSDSSQSEFKEEYNDVINTLKEIKTSEKINYNTEFKNAFEVIKLNVKKIEEVGNTKKATTVAFLFIIGSMIAWHIGVYLSLSRFVILRPSLLSMVVSTVIYIIMSVLLIAVYDIVGSKMFNGKGSFSQLFRSLGYGNLVMVLAILPVPMVGGLAGLWSLVINYKVLEVIKKLSTVNVILTMLVTFIIVSVIMYVVFWLLSFGNIGMMGLGIYSF